MKRENKIESIICNLDTGSNTMFFSIPACTFSLIVTASAGAVDISSVFVHSYSLEAFFVICKDLSCSNNASISFVLLELVLVLLHRLSYTYFILNR